ncbi:MAG: hypothetical protein MAG715_00563 [Methanonatronarchaeales archaeon]|nr:hypothetical protein [Methanonatronarchaeales archaeon]
MEAGREKAELRMELTEKELQRQYQRELSSKQQMSDYATVEVRIRQRKSVAVTPDNVWNRVKERVKRMLDNLVTIAIETFAGGIELLFRTVQAIIYLAIIAVPVAAAYRLGREVYRRYGEG